MVLIIKVRTVGFCTYFGEQTDPQNIFPWLFFWASSFNPPLGRARSRGRCWATIRLSHRPEASGHTVYEVVDGLDIGGHMVDGLFRAPHTQAEEEAIPQAGAETFDTGVEAVEPHPYCSWEGHFEGVDPGGRDESAEFYRVVQTLRVPLVLHPMHTRMLFLSDKLMSCCAEGTNECLVLRCRAFAFDGRLSTE